MSNKIPGRTSTYQRAAIIFRAIDKGIKVKIRGYVFVGGTDIATGKPVFALEALKETPGDNGILLKSNILLRSLLTIDEFLSIVHDLPEEEIISICLDLTINS